MRILVISDSHGHKWNVLDAIEREPSAEIVYFLGDGCHDYEDAIEIYGNKKAFICVRGNCDMYCDYPANDIRSIEGAKIYATHGYVERVKYGTYDLEYAAREAGCNIALFGHTHEALSRYSNGIHLFNPGSIKHGQYGVIDITDSGIICFNKYIPF